MTAALCVLAGAWVLIGVVGAWILWCAAEAGCRRMNRRSLAVPVEQVTDLDVEDPVVAELVEWPSLLYGDAYDASVAAWEYQMEVEDCCGGHDVTCGHARLGTRRS